MLFLLEDLWAYSYKFQFKVKRNSRADSAPPRPGRTGCGLSATPISFDATAQEIGVRVDFFRRGRVTAGTAASAKAGLVQPFEDMVASLLRAELPGKALGVEERRQTPNDGPFAFGIPVSADLGIGRREDRM